MIKNKIELFDTKSRQLQPLVSSDGKKLRIYSCGPTVYRDAHVGNMRTFLLGDLITRLAKFAGYKVEFVQNITDVGHMSEDFVEDKMLAQAKAESKDPFEIARIYEKRFHEDLNKLNISPADSYPKASECINLMQDLIQKLIDTDHAYVGTDNCVYFSAQSFDGYGAISGNRLDALKPGHKFEHTEDGAKRFHADWALWKAAAGRTEMIWDSPWGKGFPGWHIECSAMSSKYLGADFDIHGGGADLQFPHHENEIAQSRCANPSSNYAKYWIHNGFLTVNGEKMSKSLKNFITVYDLLSQNINGIAIRYLLLATHYRKPLDYSQKSLDDAIKSIEKFYSVFDENNLLEYRAKTDKSLQTSNLMQKILNNLCDDLNVAKVFSLLHEEVKEIKLTNNKKLQNDFIEALDFLGLLDDRFFLKVTKNNIDENFIIEQIALRAKAKAEKNWVLADKIRNDLLKQNIALEDVANGKTIWKVAK